MMSESDMSVCEQSFHFSQTAKGGPSVGGGNLIHSQYSVGGDNLSTMRGGAGMLGGMNVGASGPKSTAGSMHFA